MMSRTSFRLSHSTPPADGSFTRLCRSSPHYPQIPYFSRVILPTTLSLQDALARVGLDEAEQAAFIGFAEALVLPFGESLLSKGEVMQHFYFLTEGAVLAYETDEQAERQVRRLYASGEWMASPSLILRKPSALVYETAAETHLHRISMVDMHTLIGQSERFFMMGKVFMSEHSPFEGYQARLAPEEKYGQLMAQRPQLLQLFPLKVIASYLEMTPETLSRTRKKLSL